MKIAAHTFQPSDLIGGHVVVDLVNTVTARDADPVDWLAAYGNALEWAALTSRFDAVALAALEHQHAADPEAGSGALRRLRELRETVHSILVAAIRDEPVPKHAGARLEAYWKDAVEHARITFASERARIEIPVTDSGLEYVRHQLALDAVELLHDLPVDRLRMCPGPSCGWLFIDRSKAGRRRWCDMATCGNAAKSRRHYARTRSRKRSRQHP